MRRPQSDRTETALRKQGAKATILREDPPRAAWASRLTALFAVIRTVSRVSRRGERDELELRTKGEWQRDLARLERASAAECCERADQAATIELKRPHVIAAELHTEAAELCERLAYVYDRLDQPQQRQNG
jgi:hypothetical protein